MYIIFIKLISYKMPKTKTPFPLFFICGFLLFYTVLANQNDDQKIKETKNRIDEQNGCGIVQVETIGYLKNVKKLDLILNFLHCNKSLGFGQLEYHMEKLIQRSRGQNKGRQHDIRFICKAEHIQQRIDKNYCWLCQKQFKNQTYLAVHYTVRHLHQVSPFSPCNNLSQLSQLSSPDQSQIELILSQLLYKIVSPHELRILFSSIAPQQQVLILCQQIFARVIKAYNAKSTSIEILLDRYGPFFRKNSSDELCMIIALKMGQKTIWINVFRYVALFFLILFGISYCIYFVMKMFSQEDKQIYEFRFKKN